MKAVVSFLTVVFLVITGSGSELPFQLRDGLVWVKVSTPKGPLNFILDSGASQSVIDRESAKALGLNFGSTQSFSGVGGRGSAQWVNGVKADCAGVPLRSSLLAIDLSPFSCKCGSKIGGLLGADFFHGKIVQIDFRSHRVKFLQGMGASASAAVLPSKTPNGVPCVPVSINGGRCEWVRVDTGSNGGVEAVRESASAGSSEAATIALSTSGGAEGRGRIQIGKLEVSGVRIGWRRSAIFPGESGLLGTEVLSRFKVTLDGVHHRVALE